MTTYQVLIARPDQNREDIQAFDATSYAEALTMAERSLAGVADALFGIPVDAYDLARAEGIAFNEADGLLV
jgi:hypothetical protein